MNAMIVYIFWALFVIFSFLQISFSSFISFIMIIFAVSFADKIKKEDKSKGNRLIWLSIIIFAVVVLITFALSMGFFGFRKA